jgi:hypothetical protein
MDLRGIPCLPRYLASRRAPIACGVSVSYGYVAPNSIDHIGKDGSSSDFGNALMNACQTCRHFLTCGEMAFASVGLLSSTDLIVSSASSLCSGHEKSSNPARQPTMNTRSRIWGIPYWWGERWLVHHVTGFFQPSFQLRSCLTLAVAF